MNDLIEHDSSDFRPRTADRGPWTSFAPLLWLLSFFSLLYRIVCNARLFLYRSGLCRERKLGAMVISVGNITTGGTGKTPLVIYLAERLQESHRKVAILSRGYRRKTKKMVDAIGQSLGELTWEDVGDEPYLMARRLHDVPVIVSKHRVKSGRHAIEQYGIEILILDDGFQHLKLHRDLNIVVIDSTNPFDTGRLLPAGRLREPLTSLKRADIFVLTKTDQASDTGKLIDKLRGYNPQALLAEAIHQVRSIEKLADGSSLGLKEVEGKRALAFSGIGNPSSFENSLRQLRIQTLRHKRFSDHYPYRSADISNLQDEAKNLGADFIVTTEKDSVRIPLISHSTIPFYVLTIDLKITGGEEVLLNRIWGR
ncbi:MAG: tetraacyldisaccharide 4'-kinase [Candidatus Zixiibacteriota bacterium]